MPTPTIEEVYLNEIRPRTRAERLRLIQLASNDLAAEGGHKHSIMELQGLGKEIWQGIDAQEYVNELRAEWDKRP